MEDPELGEEILEGERRECEREVARRRADFERRRGGSAGGGDYEEARGSCPPEIEDEKRSRPTPADPPSPDATGDLLQSGGSAASESLGEPFFTAAGEEESVGYDSPPPSSGPRCRNEDHSSAVGSDALVTGHETVPAHADSDSGGPRSAAAAARKHTLRAPFRVRNTLHAQMKQQGPPSAVVHKLLSSHGVQENLQESAISWAQQRYEADQVSSSTAETGVDPKRLASKYNEVYRTERGRYDAVPAAASSPQRNHNRSDNIVRDNSIYVIANAKKQSTTRRRNFLHLTTGSSSSEGGVGTPPRFRASPSRRGPGSPSRGTGGGYGGGYGSPSRGGKIQNKCAEKESCKVSPTEIAAVLEEFDQLFGKSPGL